MRMLRWFTGLSRLLRAVVVLVAVAGVGVSLGTTGAVAALSQVFVADVPVAPPTNDALATAAPVTSAAVSFSGTTAGGTVEPGENDVSAGDRTVWFAWTPAQDSVAYLVSSTVPAATVRVYTGTAFPLHREGTGNGGAGTVTVHASTRYLIQIDTGSAGGPFDVSLLQTPAAPPNDNFDSAVTLDEAVNHLVSTNAATGSLADGTNIGGTSEAGEPAGTHSVWYAWTVPNAGATLTLTSTAARTLAAFTGSDVAHLTAVGTAGGSITLTGAAGRTTYLQVTGTEADFALSGTPAGVVVPDLTPPTVTCTAPTGWTSTGAVPCTAADSGSGLVTEADGSFTLTPTLPADSTAADAATGVHQVCDKAGNCAQAGPITGLQIDRAPPLVSCDPVPTNWLGAAAKITCTSADNGSGLASAADASFALTTAATSSTAATFTTHAPVCDKVGNCAPVLTPAAAKIDLDPPTVMCGSAPAGWHHVEVTIACTASDSGSGLADSTQRKFALTTTVGDARTDAAAATDSVQVCDAVGNCTTAGPVTGIEVDRQQPVLTCAAAPAWQHGTSVSIGCTASDNGSGLAAAGDASFVLHATIPAGTQSATASTDSRQVCDVAGNCVTAGPIGGIALDDAPPAITCQPTPTAWQDTAITVQCQAHDGGSGLAAADSVFNLSGDVANGSASDAVAIAGRQVCDVVGNCVDTPAFAQGRIDRVLPKVVCEVPGGLHHGEVTLTCTSSDVGSGLANPADARFTLRTSVGAGHADSNAMTNTHVVCDVAGNCTTAGPVGPLAVDRTGPAPGSAPSLSVPTIVHVLAARPQSALAANAGGAGAVPVPFTVPTASGAAGLTVRTACTPDPSGLFPLGSTTVLCAAEDDADRTTTVSFPVLVALAPDLAPAGPVQIGSAWPASGRGFGAGSPVSVELDGNSLGAVTASGSGAVASTVTMPAAATPGSHTLVLRGTAPDGQPMLVVVPMTLTHNQVASPAPTSPAPTSLAPGSPSSPAPTSSAPTGPDATGSGGSTPTGHGGSNGASGPGTMSGPGGTAAGTATGEPSTPAASPSGSQQTFGGGAQRPSAHPGASGSGISAIWWLLIVLLVLVVGGVIAGAVASTKGTATK